MKKDTNLKSFWNGRGFYVALAVVIGGSALASYLAVNTMMNRLGTTDSSTPNSITGQEDTTWEQNTDPVQKTNDKPVSPSSSSPAQSGASSQSASGSSSAGQQEPANWQPAQAPSFTWPMQGKVSEKYSGEELVFNKTMQDWRTHNGVDVLGALGTAVKAPASGTVVFVGQDAQWGGVVQIECGKTHVRLCGLKGTKVQKGDTVHAGDPLGELGTIPAEGVQESHLHMEFLKDGQLVNPADYFA